MITADIAHVLHTPIDQLRSEKWSDILAWHAQARRIGNAIGIPMMQMGD